MPKPNNVITQQLNSGRVPAEVVHDVLDELIAAFGGSNSDTARFLEVDEGTVRKLRRGGTSKFMSFDLADHIIAKSGFGAAHWMKYRDYYFNVDLNKNRWTKGVGVKGGKNA